MSHSSCIKHPKREPLVLIRRWHVKFCEGNKCAAALLNFYEYWHNIKLDIQSKNIQANDIAQSYGDQRAQDESLLQFHTLDDLARGINDLFSKNTLSAANKFLKSLKVISFHSNPNPKYTFDRTQYILFHPDVCNEWLNNHYSEQEGDGKIDCDLEDADLGSRDPKCGTSNPKIGISSPKIVIPSPKIGKYICKEITTEITSKKTAAETETNLALTANKNDNLNSAAVSVNHFIVDGKLDLFQVEMINQFITKHLERLKHLGDFDTLKQAFIFDLENPKSFTYAGNDFHKKFNTLKKAVFDNKWSPNQWLQESQNKTKQNAVRLKQKIQELELGRQSFINALQEFEWPNSEFQKSCESKIKKYDELLVPLYQQLKQENAVNQI